MSAVADMRQVLQDFLAPELRAVHARLDAIEEKMSTRFSSVDVRFSALEDKMNVRFATLEENINVRFSALEDNMNTRFDAVKTRISANDEIATARHNELMVRIEGLKNSLELDKRVERLENRQPQHPS